MVQLKPVKAEGKTGKKWQHESGDCSDHRPGAGTDEFADVSFEADQERQQDDADLHQHPDQSLGLNPTECRWPKNYSGHDFPDYGRNPETCHTFAHDSRIDQNRGDVKYGGRGIHLLTE